MSRDLNLSVTMRRKVKNIQINESKTIKDLIVSAISKGNPEFYKCKIKGKPVLHSA